MKLLLLFAVLILSHHFDQTSGQEDDFCKAIPIDDVMVYKGTITIFRGDHFWEVKDTTPLLTTPKMSDAKKIKDHFPGITEGSIDAISELGDEKSDQFVWVKSGKIHFMKDRKTEEKVMDLKDGFMSESGVTHYGIKNHTTLWYNKVSNHLLIFTGYRYSEYERMGDGKWKLETNNSKVVRDFKINVFIESAFTYGQSGILISKDWFFTIPLTDFKWPGTAYGGQLALGWKRDTEPLGLFNTKEDCGMDEKSYLDMAFDKDLNHGLQDKYEVGIDATYEGLPGKPPSQIDTDPDLETDELDDPEGTRRTTSNDTHGPGSGKGSGSSGNLVWYIVVPVVVLVGIAAAAFGAFMYIRSKKNRPVSSPGPASPTAASRSPSRGSKRSAGSPKTKSKSPPAPAVTPAPVPDPSHSSPSHTPQQAAQTAGSSARSSSRGSKKSGSSPRPSSPGEAIEMKPVNLPDVVRM